MSIPALAVIQARMGSTRLPGKMLLPIGGKPLIQWAWEAAVDAFGAQNVVIAVPGTVENIPLLHVGAEVFMYDGPEADVLGRFHACAHRYRTNPTDVIARITPDDWPVDLLRERFTLGWLDHAHATVTDPELREHMGHLLPKRIEINSPEDYETANAYRSPFDGGPWSPC